MLPIRKRKSIGQHILSSKQAIEEISNIILQCVPSGEYILFEIGSCDGTLTLPLLRKLSLLDSKPSFVILNEVDYRYSKNLKERLEKEGFYEKFSIDILMEDFQKVNLNQLYENYGNKKLFIIGNIPFYITGSVIRKMIIHYDKIISVVLNLQKEVVDKITSLDNPLGIVLSLRWDIKKWMIIPPHFYSPPPKVFSQIVSFRKKDDVGIDILKENISNEKFLRFLYRIFNNRRKKLKNIFTEKELELIKEYSEYRADDLKINDFLKMFQLLN